MIKLADPLFSWKLNQGGIDLIAHLFRRLETISDIVAPGALTAQAAAEMLTDLREQTVKAGAADPYPGRAMWPRLGDGRPLRKGAA